MFRVEGFVKRNQNTIIKRQPVSSAKLNEALSGHASIREIEIC